MRTRVVIVKTALFGALAAAACVAARAQGLEQDMTKYLRPVLIVPPDPPVSIAKNKTVRKYVVSVRVGPEGSIQQILSVDGGDPEFRAELDKVIQYWLFTPGVSEDCKPQTRDGKIAFEFDGTGNAPRMWAEFAGLEHLDPTKVMPRYQGAPQSPPLLSWDDERRARPGNVTVVMKVLRDGSTTEHVVLMAFPKIDGYMAAAITHAKQYRLKADEDGPAFICAAVPYVFRTN